MDRRGFLTRVTTAIVLSAMDRKSILAGSNTTLTPQAAAEVAKQATTPASVSLNQVLRVIENAKAGLDQGFPPDMTIKELLGKTPVAKASKETKSNSSRRSNEDALQRLEIGRILAAIATPAQRLSSQIQSTANKTE